MNPGLKEFFVNGPKYSHQTPEQEAREQRSKAEDETRIALLAQTLDYNWTYLLANEPQQTQRWENKGIALFLPSPMGIDTIERVIYKPATGFSTIDQGKQKHIPFSGVVALLNERGVRTNDLISIFRREIKGSSGSVHFVRSCLKSLVSEEGFSLEDEVNKLPLYRMRDNSRRPIEIPTSNFMGRITAKITEHFSYRHYQNMHPKIATN